MFIWTAAMPGMAQTPETAQLAADLRWAADRAANRMTPTQQARARKLATCVTVTDAALLPASWWWEFLQIRAQRCGAALEEDTRAAVSSMRAAIGRRRSTR